MEATTFALPATPRQIAYARSLALRNQTLLPWEIQQDRRSLGAWIDAQAQMKPSPRSTACRHPSRLPLPSVSPALNVTVRSDRYPFQRQGSRLSTLVIL
jgi:hypothetical protein